MATTNLQCANAMNLFYEPDGLLLRCCLLPADDEHRRHLLTFQLGYLGSGEITVDVSLEGGPVDDWPATAQPNGEQPNIIAARLHGAGESGGKGSYATRPPAEVNLSFITVPEGPVHYQYTVWGQAAATGSYLRGQLSVVVSGLASTLTVNTRSGVTRTPPRKPGRTMCTVCPSAARTARRPVHEH